MKRKKITKCENCENYTCVGEHTETCNKESKMTFAEFEDYFVDRLCGCPFYKKNTEVKKNG